MEKIQNHFILHIIISLIEDFFWSYLFTDFLIILFQNILFLKQFLPYNGCFGLFTKTKKGSRTSIWCTLSTSFFHKKFLTTNWQSSMLYLFPFLRYQTKCVVSPYLDNFWRIRIYLYLFRIYLPSSSMPMTEREKKGEDGNTKIWTSWQRKELFRWNKKHFFIII